MEKPSTKKPMNILKTMVFLKNFMRIARSNYHENQKEEFEIEIISEDEENYYVRLLPEWQNQYQEHDEIHPLRKCLFGDNGIYKFINKKYIECPLDL